MFRLFYVLRWAWNSGHIVEVMGGIGTINLLFALYYRSESLKPFSRFGPDQLMAHAGFGLVFIGLALLFWIGQRFIRHQNHQNPEIEPEAKSRITRGKFLLEQFQFELAEQEFSIAAEYSAAAQIVHWRAIARYGMGNFKGTTKDLQKAMKRYTEEGQAGHAAALQRFLNG